MKTAPDGALESAIPAEPQPDITLSFETPALSRVTANPEAFRLQILVSEVVRDRRGRASLRRVGYRTDAEYFYPASAIKLLGAIAACEVFDEIDAERRALGIFADGSPALDAPLAFRPLFEGQSTLDADATNLDGTSAGRVTLRHELRKLFLVSDNPAYNRVYELAGQEDLNRRMWAAGLPSVRLSHRLSESRSREQNRMSPAIDIGLGEGVRTIPQRTSTLDLTTRGVPGLDVGEAVMRYAAQGAPSRVQGPMNFANLNRVSIIDLQNAMVLLARPDIDIGLPGYRLDPRTRRTLIDMMREYPGDSANPAYDRGKFPDEWGKFLLPGIARVVPKGEISIATKVGQAYGFTIENAYVEHTPTGRAFFLTAALYTNADGVLNDDRYEYSDVALPFLADLGETVARMLWRE